MKHFLTGLLFSVSLFINLSANEPLRQVASKDPQGYTIELDDGSIWKVTEKSLYNAKNYYKSGDLLVIYPVIFPFFSDSKFYFVNQSNGTSINVDLSLGPVSSNPCCIEIEDIDYNTGKVWLKDGRGYRTLWRINIDDISKFNRWLRGQAIILGSNKRYNDTIGSSFKYILINVEKNNYIQASMLQ
ncbi:MAG: hypothetical protein ACOYK9_00720 [Chlamydiia bacterium]